MLAVSGLPAWKVLGPLGSRDPMRERDSRGGRIFQKGDGWEGDALNRWGLEECVGVGWAALQFL